MLISYNLQSNMLPNFQKLENYVEWNWRVRVFQARSDWCKVVSYLEKFVNFPLYQNISKSNTFILFYFSKCSKILFFFCFLIKIKKKMSSFYSQSIILYAVFMHFGRFFRKYEWFILKWFDVFGQFGNDNLFLIYWNRKMAGILKVKGRKIVK